ncbi:MAG: 3',5'-cyclic-AMP phosphodiesterase [Halioglobus sp.]
MQSDPPSKISKLNHQQEVVRLAQLTDCHLCHDEGGTLLGMDTDHSLKSVIARVKKERPEIDLALFTGDLADHGSIAAYRRMEAYSRELIKHSFWLPGNHDDLAEMLAAGIAPERMSAEIHVGRWQILMLDTQVPGDVGGELGTHQLQLLERALQRAQAEDLHTLICLHHHPVNIGCAWLDKQMVSDADDFFELIDSFTSVKGVLWGHVHQQLDSERNGVKLLASPSTCVQFAPGSEDFRADNLAPGYRWLELHASGAIETGVSRVDDEPFNVDLASTGYLDH